MRRVGMTQISTLDPNLRDSINSQSQQLINRCFACSKCTAGCPIARTADLRPAHMVRLVQFGMADALLNNPTLWRCLGCDLCGARCPNDVHIGTMLAAVRRLAWDSARAGTFADPALVQGLERLAALRDHIAQARNITGDDNGNRLLWSQNLDRVPEGLERKTGAEIVFFVGCVGSLFPQSYRIPQAMTQVLMSAGANFTALGGEEWCCGYPLIAAGLGERARELAEHNVEMIQRLGARELVATCPSCFHMWKHYYPELLGHPVPFEIKHSTELLVELLNAGALKLNPVEATVTYHDPCDLCRKGGIFDAPRITLDAIPSLRFSEMTNYGKNALCCGGGGNLETFDAALVAKVAAERLDDAVATGANLLVSACQQCERTLTSASRKHEGARKARLKVTDIVELVSQAVAS